MRYMRATAESLHAPRSYIAGVLAAGGGFRRPQGNPPMTRLLPFPLLSTGLLALWLLLNQALSLGKCLLGCVIALVGGWALTLLDPPKAKIRRPGLILRLCVSVFADILRSNIAVARIILSPGERKRRSGFVTIPLDLRDPYGLAVLACIITSTPGTLWASFNPANRDIADSRPRPDRRARVGRDHQEPIRAAAAGDL